MTWRPDAPQGSESHKVRWDVVPYTRGVVLDLGCGPERTFGHWLTVDSCVDTELFGITIKPDVKVPDCADLSDAVNDESVDAVFSSHLLEHIVNYKGALAEWWRVLKTGGHLVLYLPHRDLYPNIGQPGANIDHKHDFVPDDIELAMAEVAYDAGTGWDLLVNEVRDGGDEYSFLMVFQKIEHTELNRSHQRAKPAKTACVVRYGGFGDMIQAANLLPELKRQGYHVTFMTTPKGQDIVRHDPHIDAWFIQDDNQVPNQCLPEFWAAQAARFDKFIQLSESVEGTLLAMPGRANHAWPHAVRAVELNRNYLEWTSQLAELPYMSEARFYPSAHEQAMAAGVLGGIHADRAPKELMIGEQGPDSFFIMWTLAGSSMHKFYPHMDAVIARVLLEIPEAVFILTGDEACQLLEAGWELEPRVYKKSGKLSIRDTLTLAIAMDCVVGPETGVLNAVAFENNDKVVLLSHSTVENLTKHWINTTSLTAPFDPRNTVCGNLACHQLHYGSAFCVEDKATGAAACQSAIAPGAVFDAIHAAYRRWKGTP